MTTPGDRDPIFVDKAVSEILAVRPAYTSLLAFYGPVFVAQAEAAAETYPPAIPVDDQKISTARENGEPLITPAAFTADAPAAVALLREVCRIAADTGERLAGAGEALSRAMDGGLDVPPLFFDALDAKRRMDTLANELKAPVEMLVLLVHLALQPSISAGARQLAAHLDKEPADRATCPICGSPPSIGELDDNGARWLHCRLCRHRWPIRRILCASCGNSDADTLGYLYSEQEAEYRVSLCERCKHYLKVVDTRKLNRPFFAPLEQVVTLHLDMLVGEKGYSAMEG